MKFAQSNQNTCSMYFDLDECYLYKTCILSSHRSTWCCS